MAINLSLLKETSYYKGTSSDGMLWYDHRSEEVEFDHLNRDRTVAFHGGRVRFTPDGYAVPAFNGDGTMEINWAKRDRETNFLVEGRQFIEFVNSVPVDRERIPSLNLSDLNSLSFRADCGLPWAGLIVDFDKSTFEGMPR